MLHLVLLFIVLTRGHNPCNHTSVESAKCVFSTKTASPQTDWTHTYEIQSRDRVSLNTIVHFEDFERTKHATILERTPYDCSKLSPSMYTSRGFHYAAQDFRGRFGSGGEFSFWAHGAEDASDTFTFLQKQDWTNGHYFAVGTSADGIACYLEPKESPPLFGQYVVVGTPNVHRSAFQQGAFRKSLIEGWLAGIDESAFITQILQQESYNAFWADQDVTKEWTKANWPSIHYGGWFDIFQFSTIEAFEGYDKQGGPLGRGLGYLFIDPLGHCQKDQNNYPNAREYFVLSLEFALELFKTISRDLQVLEARGGEMTTEEKRAVFEGAIEAAHQNTEKKFQTNYDKLNLYLMGPSDVGARGNKWISFPAWPTVTPMVGYFGKNGSISWSAPPSAPDSASYLYNPSHPVVTLGGNNLVLPTCGSYDQREVENGRTDVLSFTSPPSPSDVTFIGPVSARLFVSSNATDTDFTVKWLDVYPDGRRMLLQDGIVRMRWRKMPDAPSQPSCIVPGTIYEISVDLQYIAFVLNKGHSIGVSVSSSNHPRFSANPNTCQPLTSNKPPVIAHNSLYMSTTSPSSITLPLVHI